MITLADTFNVECPKCRALPGRFCPIRSTTNDDPAGTWSHDERWTAAQAKAASNDAALLAVARCFPPGFLEAVAAVLVEGGKAKGCAPHETGGGQTLYDHVRHALRHIEDVRVVGGEWVGDTQEPYRIHPDDGEDVTHAAARLALAFGMDRAARGKASP